MRAVGKKDVSPKGGECQARHDVITAWKFENGYRDLDRPFVIEGKARFVQV